MFKSMQKDHKLITRKELQIAVCHKQTLGFYMYMWREQKKHFHNWIVDWNYVDN